MNKIIFILLTLLSPLLLKAQEVEMADAMHENGKIYVVVGVLSIIFVGIIIYLIAIDKKVSRLQKRIEDQ